ncbi:MAG: hypothetical protein PHD97_12555 [Bacteroidales bacterium]|nr:hypothetical protein [Bacteroidales bacterium]
MKVSGFTFIRNAIKFDYPVVEAINSILPLCDEFVVAVGNSEDETLHLIKNINSPKIKIINTVWDDTLREGGRVLAVETDKALKNISSDSDWAFYIQADETVHEKYLPVIKEAMLKWNNNKDVEGLLFDYLHFYGSYDYIGAARKWYRKEVRIIRNDKTINSFGDAMGFRKNGNKLNVKQINAFVYHYGWVKPPEAQQAKQQTFHKLWHPDDWLKKNIPDVESFDYSQIDSLEKFDGTHPAVMQKRIDAMNWKFSFEPKKKKNIKTVISDCIEKWTGWRIGEYKNYKII